MEHIDILNLVNNVLYRAKSGADYKTQIVCRNLEFVPDKAAYIKDELIKLDFETCAFGHYYINSGFHAGNTRVGIRETMTDYYMNNPIFKEITDPQEKENYIRTDAYNFFAVFELEQNLRKLLAEVTKPVQGTQQEGGQPAPLIPTILGKNEEKVIYQKALNEGYMTLNNGCYKWNNRKYTYTLLAYMCGRIYCDDKIIDSKIDYNRKYIKGTASQMPAKELKALFGVDVAKHRSVITENMPPRGYEKIDKLFR